MALIMKCGKRDVSERETSSYVSNWPQITADERYDNFHTRLVRHDSCDTRVVETYKLHLGTALILYRGLFYNTFLTTDCDWCREGRSLNLFSNRVLG